MPSSCTCPEANLFGPTNATKASRCIHLIKWLWLFLLTNKDDCYVCFTAHAGDTQQLNLGKEKCYTIARRTIQRSMGMDQLQCV